MTLTLEILYNECASQPWSMYDNDVEEKEDLEGALRISINKAISDIWNMKSWKFRKKTQTIKLKPNKSEYIAPEGKVIKKTKSGETKFLVKYGKKYLKYNDGIEFLEEKTGEPEQFYIEDDKIIFYPTPNGVYDVKIDYLSSSFGLNEENQKLYELTEMEDYIDISKRYEVKFKNCVISLAMIYAIAETGDESYEGYTQQYDRALSTLTDACEGDMADRYIVYG